MTDPETEPYWNPEHPVLTILRRRRDTGSKPGHRRDTAKVALAIAGGGMRGVISGAMCTQLDDAGFKDSFDVVYGCSSGAINGAYFVAQECWHPLSVYYDDLATKRFLDYSRALRGGSVVDLDYVFDHVLRSVKPLNYQAAVDSSIPLVVSVTDMDARKTTTVRDFATAEELEATLRAGTQLPLAVTGSSKIDGPQLLDGALLTPLPFRLAVDDGCTHILSLSTHRIQEPKQRISFGHRYYQLYLERLRRGLGTAYLDAVRGRQRDREWLASRRYAFDTAAPHVLDLAPLPWMPELRFHEIDPRTVFNRARDAYGVSHCATEAVSTDRLLNGSIRATPKMTILGADDIQPLWPQTGDVVARGHVHPVYAEPTRPPTPGDSAT